LAVFLFAPIVLQCMSRLLAPSGHLEPRTVFAIGHEAFPMFGLFLWQAG
jgi:hypothetical protein